MRIETFVLTPFQQNTRIVSCEATRAAICIDPGEPSNNVVNYIRDNELDLRAIVITHGHLDHCGGTSALYAAFPQAEVLLHEEEVYLYEALPQQPLMMGLKPHELRAMGLEYEPPPPPSRFVAHGEKLDLGELSFEIRHCPGHTLGHIVLVEANERAVFTGDCLFSGSIGRTDLPGGDYERLIGSIREQVLSLDDGFTVYCGHGPETTVGRERESNPFLA